MLGGGILDLDFYGPRICEAIAAGMMEYIIIYPSWPLGAAESVSSRGYLQVLLVINH